MLDKKLYEDLEKAIEAKDQKELEQFLENLQEEFMYYTVRLYAGQKQNELDTELKLAKRFRKKLMSAAVRDMVSYQSGIFEGILKTITYMATSLQQKKNFEQQMAALYTKSKVKDILNCIYRNPNIQHKILAENTGTKANYLSQLLRDLEQAGCVLRYASGKRSFYELSLDGLAFVQEHRPLGTDTFTKFGNEFPTIDFEKYNYAYTDKNLPSRAADDNIIKLSKYKDMDISSLRE